jgi:hypothetical protein
MSIDTKSIHNFGLETYIKRRWDDNIQTDFREIVSLNRMSFNEAVSCSIASRQVGFQGKKSVEVAHNMVKL